MFSQAQNIPDIGNLKCHDVYYLFPEDERVKKSEGTWTVGLEYKYVAAVSFVADETWIINLSNKVWCS